MDFFAYHGEELRRLRRQMQIIFQDPVSSLNPRMTVGNIIGEHHPSPRHRQGQAKERTGRGPPASRRPGPLLCRPLSPRILRRPAPTYRHRPRPGPFPRLHRLRRTGVGAGCVDPIPDSKPAQRPPERARHRLPVHRPQLGGRGAFLGRCGGHVPGEDRREGVGPGTVQQSQAPLYLRVALGGARAGPASVPSPHRVERGGSFAVESSQRLSVPSPLPVDAPHRQTGRCEKTPSRSNRPAKSSASFASALPKLRPWSKSKARAATSRRAG